LGKCVVGVEVDDKKAAVARQFCKDFIVGDIEKQETIESLRSLRHKYDLILCSEVLEHLSRPDRLLLQLRDFLQPTGAILVVLPNVAFYKTRLSLLRGKWDYTDEGILDRTHLRFFTKHTAEMLLTDSGFRIVANKATHYSRRYATLYNYLVEWWPDLFAEQFVTRAE